MQMTEILASIQVREPLRRKGLDVFPLDMPGDMTADYVMLDELLDGNLAEITEVSAAGQVPELVVSNNADADALIVDGTELHGAKQDRMVNITLIIAGHTRETIPVTCVESGRWSYRTRSFSSSKRTVAGRLRWSKARSVYDHLAMAGIARSDQRKVWAEVADYQSRAGSRSDSEALRDAFKTKAREIEELAVDLREIDAHGVVVALNGSIMGMDLITHRRSFGKLWPGLLHGYAMDAVLEERKESSRVEADAVRAWLSTASRGLELKEQKVPGAGRYFSCKGSGVGGGVVEHLGKPVHVMLFPDDTAGPDSPTGHERGARS